MELSGALNFFFLDFFGFFWIFFWLPATTTRFSSASFFLPLPHLFSTLHLSRSPSLDRLRLILTSRNSSHFISFHSIPFQITATMDYQGGRGCFNCKFSLCASTASCAALLASASILLKSSSIDGYPSYPCEFLFYSPHPWLNLDLPRFLYSPILPCPATVVAARSSEKKINN